MSTSSMMLSWSKNSKIKKQMVKQKINVLKILISRNTLLASITSSKALWMRLIATYWPVFLSSAEKTCPYAPLPTHFFTSYRSSTVIRPSLHSNCALPLILLWIYLTRFGSFPFWINFCFYSNFSSFSFSFLSYSISWWSILSTSSFGSSSLSSGDGRSYSARLSYWYIYYCSTYLWFCLN